jgi:hypothetical protein
MENNNHLRVSLQAYLQTQTNPGRVGCPTFQSVAAFLWGHLHPLATERFGDHLPRCRECLVELRTLRDLVQEAQ